MSDSRPPKKGTKEPKTPTPLDPSAKPSPEAQRPQPAGQPAPAPAQPSAPSAPGLSRLPARPGVAPDPSAPAPSDDPADRPSMRSAGESTEAHDLFPMVPTSDLRSSYFPDSYKYPYNPDPLCANNRYDTYDEMRKDQQVKSCLALKKDILVNSGWEIECEDEAVKDEIEQDLRNMADPETADSGFEDSLRSMKTDYDYGFSVTEVVVELKDGRYVPKSLRTRAPHSWQFDLDDKGNIRQLVQMGASGPKKLNPKHFIHCTYQSDFGNPYGTADLQSAHQPWKAKKFFMRMFAVYVERFASPTIVARYKPGAQEDEIAAIQAMAKSIANSTAMTLPEDVAVDFVQAARDATDAYVRGIALWDMMIARALLVPDLMGMSGEKSGGGSLSLGEVQFKLFLGTVQKDRKSLERKVNLRLIQPLAKLNYGDKADPKLKLNAWSDENMKANMELWLKAVSVNAYIPGPEEVDHFRRAIKFPTPPVEVTAGLQPMVDPNDPNADPEAQDGDEGAQPAKDKGGFPPKGPKGAKPVMPRGPMTNGGKPGKPAPKPEPAGRKFSEDAGKLLIFRDLTSYERKIDFASVKRSLDVSERGFARSVGEAAAKMTADLMRQIRDSKLLTRFQPEAIAGIQPGFAREMNEAMRSEFRALFRESCEEARREILPAGDKSYASEDMLPEEFERILEAETFQIVGSYRTDITKKTHARLTSGIKAGMSEGRLTVLLREDLKENTERWLNTLTRTKTTEIYNSARKSVWDTDPVIKQIVEAYQFSSVLDERTSDVCRGLDGKIFEKGVFVDRATPPLHYNCRSILVPITKFETYTASKPESLEKLKEQGGNLIQA